MVSDDRKVELQGEFSMLRLFRNLAILRSLWGMYKRSRRR
jgi:hypothetical protein